MGNKYLDIGKNFNNQILNEYNKYVDNWNKSD